jgi:hypothetical protein
MEKKRNLKNSLVIYNFCGMAVEFKILEEFLVKVLE